MANCRKCGREMILQEVNDISKALPSNSGYKFRHFGHPILGALASGIQIVGKLGTINEYYCRHCDSKGIRVEGK